LIDVTLVGTPATRLIAPRLLDELPAGTFLVQA